MEGKKGGFGMQDEEDEAKNVVFFLKRILIWRQRSFQDGASLSFLPDPAASEAEFNLSLQVLGCTYLNIVLTRLCVSK